MKARNWVCWPFGLFAGSRQPPADNVVIISANAEWKALLAIVKPASAELRKSPYGEWFFHSIQPAGPNAKPERLIFFHGGWGKVDAAGSAQWAILHWRPKRIINLGTAGGFAGKIKEGEIVFVTRSVIYDIIQRMGNPDEAIQDYATNLNPESPQLQGHVRPGVIVSADQDLDPASVHTLAQKYGAVAGDWESGSIARVCKKNGMPVLILRGISDIVSAKGSRTYGNLPDFERQSRFVLKRLLGVLPHVL